MLHRSHHLFFWAVFLHAFSASAEGSFSWTRGAGAAACPSREEAMRVFQSLSSQPLTAALQDRSLEVLLVREENSWIATLYWRSPQGALLGERVLRSTEERCSVFTSAAMTAVMVTLGANAISNEIPRENTTAPTEVTPPPPPTVVTPPVSVSVVPRRTSEVRFGDISLGGVISWGWIPPTAWGMQLYAEPFVYRRLRLGVSVTTMAESTWLGSSGSVSFSALDFALDVCGVLLRAQEKFELLACGSARAGAVQSFVYDNSVSARGTSGAFALQASPMFRVTPAGPLVIAVDPALRWNVSRYTLLSRDQTTTVVQQDPLAFVLSIRIGVQIP